MLFEGNIMIRFVKNKVQQWKNNRKWRKLNRNNSTSIRGSTKFDLIKVGNYTYGGINVLMFNEKSRIRIGNYCSIGPNVCFVVSADHAIGHISTFPYKVKVLEEQYEGISKGNIIVEDDVWIGYGATILSGVHIGQGAVIAAGAVVTKDVPPYAVVGGVPAKVIKYRFEPDIIDELMKVDYSKLTKEMIEEHIDDLYQELTDVKQLGWMPRRCR